MQLPCSPQRRYAEHRTLFRLPMKQVTSMASQEALTVNEMIMLIITSNKEIITYFPVLVLLTLGCQVFIFYL